MAAIRGQVLLFSGLTVVFRLNRRSNQDLLFSETAADGGGNSPRQEVTWQTSGILGSKCTSWLQAVNSRGNESHKKEQDAKGKQDIFWSLSLLQ